MNLIVPSKLWTSFLLLSLLLPLLLTSCHTRTAGLLVPCPTMTAMTRDQLESACGTDIEACPMVQNWIQRLARYCMTQS